MTEEHEEIPWSMLVDHDRRSRSRTLYIGAAVVIALVVIVTGIRWVDSHRHGPTEPVAVASSTTTVPPPTTTVVSEADLMPVDSATDRLAAIARAEWFITDYFTIDGSPAPGLLDAFTDDAVLPDLPQLTGDSAVSFVEWARATAVRSHPGGYAVTVLYRTLYENAEQRFERSPVRGVDVLVIVDGERTAIAELPVAVPIPVAHGVSGWMDTSSDVSGEVISAALEDAARLTQNPALLESGGSGAVWRVVYTFEDPSGVRFPMVLRSDIVAAEP
jgi:hypothetical protein